MSVTPTSASGTCSVSSRRPSPPPVTSEFRRISTEPAWAKARVTIANEMPLTRRPTAPSTSATRMPARSVSAIAGSSARSVRSSTIAQAVGADREVERMAEGEQPGHPEDHVVAQGERGEQQAQGQQLERSRRVRRTGQHPGHAEVDQRQHEQQPDEDDGTEDTGPRSARDPRAVRGPRPVLGGAGAPVSGSVSDRTVMPGLPSVRRVGRAAPRRAAARRRGHRSRRRRSWRTAGAPRPTTEAIAAPSSDPRPPMTVTMKAKINSEAPELGRDVAEVVRGEHATEAGGCATDGEDDREGAAYVDAERGDHRSVLDSGPDHQAEAGEPQEAR